MRLDTIPEGMSRAAAVTRLHDAFAAAGLDTPRLDARLLVLAALGLDAVALVTHAEVAIDGRAAAALDVLARRRLAREPVQRILGRAEFWSLPFRLSRDTLVPRPDSETLVATALALAPGRETSLRVLDLGTGTGCLLVALLHERPRAWGLGVDRSPDALATAAGNARLNAVGDRAAFAASDWTAAVAGPFDLIVSNPPYIATGIVAGLEPEVLRHDPAAALDGGPDGLAAYRRILAEARRLLAPDGALVLEIGHDQEDALVRLAAAHGLSVLRRDRDLGGHVRAVALGPPSAASLADRDKSSYIDGIRTDTAC